MGNRQVKLRCALAVVLALGVLAGPSVALSGDSSDSSDGRILYAARNEPCDPHCVEELVTVNVDGSDRAALPVDVDVVWGPVWSPDGSQLAYYDRSEEEIHLAVMNADGSGARRLTASDPLTGVGQDTFGSPAWSPDGMSIAYTSQDDEAVAAEPDYDVCSFSIRVVNVDGLVNREVVKRGSCLGTPRWSPDGGQLLFTQCSCEDWVYDRVWVVNASGGDPTLLVDRADSTSGATWSPDGRRILFVALWGGKGKAVRTIRPDGTRPKRLTRWRWGIGNPAWSPSGRWIAYQGPKPNRPKSKPEIYLVKRDGSERKRITWNKKSDLDPLWSPSSRYLLFDRLFDRYFRRVIVMDLSSDRKWMLAPDEHVSVALGWQAIQS